MSLIVIAVSMIATLVCIIAIANKNNTNIVYAEKICFAGNINGFEISIFNNLVINENLVEIKPSNCTVKPEFTIKEFGSKETATLIKDKYEFIRSGRYTLSCKIKSNENYYIKDSIMIMVVDKPTSATSMYIDVNKGNMLYVDGSTNLKSLVNIVAPSSANIEYNCSKHISLCGDVVTALSTGLGTIDVVVTYDNIAITQNITVIVRAKVVEGDISLKLNMAEDELGGIIEIDDWEFNYILNYELTNIAEQSVECWTSSNIIEVISCNAPTIILKPKYSGQAVLYISPTNYKNVVFEIIIHIH